MTAPLVGIVMGSDSDWEVMQHASRRLQELGVPHESRVVSAHRTPDLLFRYAEEARGRGLRCIIAGAGGAAHLPGMLAAKTTLPVLGVPVTSAQLQGLDSLLSIVQMPAGVPVATFAIGQAGRAQRGTLRGRDPRAHGPGARRAARRVPRGADRARPQARRSRSRRDPARRHRRHARRRPARPHVHAPGPLDGLRGGRARSRSAEPGRPRGRPSPPGRLHRRARPRRARRRLRRRSRPNSRTSRRRRWSAWRGRASCGPPVGAVAIAQDRIAEKRFLHEAGLRHRPLPRRCTRRPTSSRPLRSDPLARAAQDQPAGLRRQGTGDGDRRCRRAVRRSSGSAACPACSRSGWRSRPSCPWCSPAGDDGAVAAFPVGENRHRDGILETTVVPARVPERLAEEARALAIAVAERMAYVGVLGVELFVANGGRLFVNEMAPRPHNSGHYTMDACAVDQFEQQLRTLCGLPLGEPRLLTPVRDGQPARRPLGPRRAALGRGAPAPRRAAAPLRQGRAAGRAGRWATSPASRATPTRRSRWRSMRTRRCSALAPATT